MVTDLIVRGGTVVTVGGSRRADVAIEGGSIAAIGLDLGGDAREVVDATGLLILPGVIDVHTHTRVATDAEPDRFFHDSVAAAFGGTTTFLAFNNPGTGASERTGRTLLDEPSRLAIADRGRFRGRLRGQPRAHAHPGGPDLRAVGGHRRWGYRPSRPSWSTTSGSTIGPSIDALAATGSNGGMLEVHCENAVLLEELTARHLEAGETAPRYHAASRPPYVEAEATARAMALARAARAPLYVVHLSCVEALAAVRAGQADGLAVFAETCPHYLTLDDSRYELPPEEAAKYVISPPLRAPGQGDGLWAGLSDGSLALVSTDHVPDRVGVEKQTWRESFDRISNGGPGIETLLALVYSEGVARGRITVERMVDLLSTTPARLFGLANKGALEVGRDADLVLFDPSAPRVIRQADLHHTSDYTPYEGREVVGAVRSVTVRGAWVVRDGVFVGRRGHGRFVERQLGAVGSVTGSR